VDSKREKCGATVFGYRSVWGVCDKPSCHAGGERACSNEHLRQYEARKRAKAAAGAVKEPRE